MMSKDAQLQGLSFHMQLKAVQSKMTLQKANKHETKKSCSALSHGIIREPNKLLRKQLSQHL